MLELLTFDLMVQNPYHILFELLGSLDLVHNKRLRQSAWAFCSDACLTTVPLLLEARDTAISAIFFASIHTEQPIDDVNGEPWWKALKGDEERCSRAIERVLHFYSENPLRKQNPSLPSPAFDIESTRRPRDPVPHGEALSSSAGTPRDGDRANGRDDVSVTESASQLTLTAPKTNGNGAVSPAPKRKDIDSDAESRASKRARLSDEDEGEVVED